MKIHYYFIRLALCGNQNDVLCNVYETMSYCICVVSVATIHRGYIIIYIYICHCCTSRDFVYIVSVAETKLTCAFAISSMIMIDRFEKEKKHTHFYIWNGTCAHTWCIDIDVPHEIPNVRYVRTYVRVYIRLHLIYYRFGSKPYNIYPYAAQYCTGTNRMSDDMGGIQKRHCQWLCSAKLARPLMQQTGHKQHTANHWNCSSGTIAKTKMHRTTKKKPAARKREEIG